MRLPLYLRIWLAVLAAVAVITISFGWLWRLSADEPPPREVLIRTEDGQVLGSTRTRPVFVPGQGIEFPVAMKDGSTVVIQMPPRRRGPGEGPPPPRPWLRGTDGLIWMLVIVAVAVAVGSYPIIRRLTQRLESLRAGVERLGEGDLSARVAVEGSDEVASLARRFNQAAERIEQLVKSHKSLLANASHELRSPLARIRMGLELLESQPGPAAREEIARNIRELDQLIDEILLASRLDASPDDLGPLEPVDLVGLAAEECARTDAELQTPPGVTSVVVTGLTRLLRRALRNLLENARRHGAGTVTLTLRTDGGQAEIRVCDQGPGVPAPLRERIFEPFFRLPGASEREGGVGLGLALVRSIVQRHGGGVHCEENPGGGACFVLRLPIAS